MNVFISADIEGTCGIASWLETDRGTMADYRPFQRQMTREVQGACLGAMKGGAKSIFVKDAHDSARNIDPLELPECTKMLRGWTGDLLSMMSGLDREKFDVAFLTGYHTWAGGGGNPLAHTMNLGNEYVLLNGARCSEFLINAYTAGYYGVPVALLTGDKMLCEYAQTVIPKLVTVAVNEGVGGGVVSVHPEVAIKAIREGAERAMKVAAKCAVVLPDAFETTVRFRAHEKAFSKSFYPDATLEDGKNVCFRTDDWFELLRFYHFVLSD